MRETNYRVLQEMRDSAEEVMESMVAYFTLGETSVTPRPEHPDNSEDRGGRRRIAGVVGPVPSR